MAKRISLREFQEGLVRRLTSAARGESSYALLGIQAGREHWLLSLADAGEIVPLPPLTTVPLTRPWFVGIANIRGMLYSVVDFSAFQGGEPTPLNSAARLLLIGARHGVNSALLVSRTLGLKNPETLELDPSASSSTGDPGQPWIGELYREKQGNTQVSWRMLRTKPLLVHPDFLDIGL